MDYICAPWRSEYFSKKEQKIFIFYSFSIGFILLFQKSLLQLFWQI